MIPIASIVATALWIASASAQAVPEWGQCGGIGWGGSTVCASGLTCVKQNDYYSQCIKSTNAPAPTTTPVPTTTNPGPTTTAAPPPASTGFVKTSGQRFTLNGSKYTVVGANSYWVGLGGLSTTDMNKAFADIAKAGGTTVRTWSEGFNEVTSTNGLPYYQRWSGSTPTVNTGADGLQNFDNVVAAAKANGIRLIVALTNNWADYGGMDVYVNQIVGQGQPHDLFYTNANVISAFKKYISAFVGRYKNEPTILAWELANEPRCKGTTGYVDDATFQTPPLEVADIVYRDRTSSGTCTTQTITKWATDISAYIKSIDSNHLVGLGDEGFFNKPGNPSYPYQCVATLDSGGEGIDFDANLKISSLDFGTFHAYPIPWGESANPTAWGVQWINDHAASQKAANKPVIIEEYGLDSTAQASAYQSWLSTVVSSGLTGDLIWQAGSILSNGQRTHDDGYTIYPDDPVYAILTSHNAAMKARA
ncbi:hypothetical protein PQX77_009033 [Marasmius sp. AFHP31]|nr:hypothetical protein PQX77_009033 [Marasmius sp. AFHP31]